MNLAATPSASNASPCARLFFLSQQSHQVVHETSCSHDDLRLLFFYLGRVPELLHLAIEEDIHNYFAQSESAAALLFAVMRDQHVNYGQVAFEPVCAEIRRRVAPLPSFPQEQIDDLCRSDEQGLAWFALSAPANFTPSYEHGRDQLLRFLRERTIAAPLRRLLTQSRSDHYPRDLISFIGLTIDADEHIRRLGASRALPRRLGALLDLHAAGQLEIESLIDGVLAKQGLALLHADSGVGKTLLMANLDLSLATGTPFLENQPFASREPTRVGLYSNESGAAILARNIQNMLRAKLRQLQEAGDPRAPEIVGLAREHLDVITDSLPDLGSTASVRRWVRECREARYTKVSIDPLFNCLGSLGDDLKNSAKIYPKLDYVVKLCEESGIQLQAAHHDVVDRQQRTGDWPSSQKLAYPVLRQMSRQIISVSRGAAYDEETRCSTLHMVIAGKGNVAGGAYIVQIVEGRNHDSWACTVTPRREAILQAEAEQTRATAELEHQQVARILDSLRESQSWDSPTELSRRLPGLSDARIRSLMERAVRAGTVHIRRTPHGSQTRIQYRCETSASSPGTAGGSGGGGGSVGRSR